MDVGFIEKILIATIVVLGLAACGDSENLKNAVRDNLLDPDSAKFYDYKIIDDQACYIVNAKNSMGGYTGKKVATFMKINGRWMSISFLELTLDDCLKIIKKSNI